MVSIFYNQYVLIIQEFKGVGFGGCLIPCMHSRTDTTIDRGRMIALECLIHYLVDEAEKYA